MSYICGKPCRPQSCGVFGVPGTQFTCFFFPGTKIPEMAVYTALSPTK